MCYCVVCSVSDCILYVLAVVFPPVAVLLRSGFFSADLLLNVLLTMLGFFPGLIHAWYYITVTSPLRLYEDGVYYYEQGWVDSETGGNRTYGPHDEMSVRSPLLSVNDALRNQEQQPGGPLPLKQGAPPPYSERP